MKTLPITCFDSHELARSVNTLRFSYFQGRIKALEGPMHFFSFWLIEKIIEGLFPSF
jgi:hypothetical protein